MICLRKLSVVSVIGLGVMTGVVVAGNIFYTFETDYLNAIAAIDAGAVFGLEDFSSSALGDLGAGPTAFNGFDIALNGIGNGGSFTGIINPGEFDGTNALEARVVLDTSDFWLIPNVLFLLGEGVESMDFFFSTAVIGFAADWNSTTTHDGVRIRVNGAQINLGDHLPNNGTSGGLNDGDGFLGIVDPNLISSFSLSPDDRDVSATFEDFELDDLQFATSGLGPPRGDRSRSRCVSAGHHWLGRDGRGEAAFGLMQLDIAGEWNGVRA